MPTALDRTLNSKNALLTFAGLVTAVSVWAIWGSDVFPSQDPTGDPSTWEISELRRWLQTRNLLPSETATREQLVERVQANLQPRA